MKSYSVTISGVSPLLMHAFTDEAAMAATMGERGTHVASRDDLPREKARAHLYHSPDGTIIVPGPNLLAALVDAGRLHKLGKSKLTTNKSSLVPAYLGIEEVYIPITPAEWEVDVRPICIPATGGRILRYRPRFDQWALTFTLQLLDADMTAGLARGILDDAGTKIGLGDFRPARKGPFGRFKVTTWAAC